MTQPAANNTSQSSTSLLLLTPISSGTGLEETIKIGTWKLGNKRRMSFESRVSDIFEFSLFKLKRLWKVTESDLRYEHTASKTAYGVVVPTTSEPSKQ